MKNLVFLPQSGTNTKRNCVSEIKLINYKFDKLRNNKIYIISWKWVDKKKDRMNEIAKYNKTNKNLY